MPFQTFIFPEKIHEKGKLQELKIHFEKNQNRKKTLHRNLAREKKLGKMMNNFLFKKNDQ
ncbi:hypothetical protein [Mucilaginibacter ginsenosidivorans]|uniref:hypothetical protein n=1 Tax=Mucilaginibacter ginsenosidivorans TaxID=398053 RepID=UPI001E4E1DC0|nr:hypothetical protein [Mucilaginibacter ginsenosidivorans]